MDRAIVYDAALPQTLDVLNTNKFTLNALAYASQAILGGNIVVAGLVAAPTQPVASLNITIGAGSIYSAQPVDTSAYGDLGVDTTHTIIKQGILYDPVTLTITPPSTPGQSQVYLVEAIYNDVDDNTTVLPYFNAQNPLQPLSGPANSGSAQFTTRLGKCIITLKAGAPATTGTEVAPAPDVGYVGLYTIDVPNGDLQITANQIVTLATAPFFWTLPSIPGGVQANAWTFCLDTGIQNAMVGTVWPPITTLQPGYGFLVKAAFGNTGTATFAIGSAGAQPIHRANGAVLQSGDYAAGMIVALVWDGAAFQMLNFEGFSSTTTNNNTYVLNIPYAVDSGIVNAPIGLFSPPLAALTAGSTVEVFMSFTNTGPSTLQANALAARPISYLGAVATLPPRALVAGQVAQFIYDGTNFSLQTPRNSFITINLASPPAADYVLAIGDQINITFNNLQTVPLYCATTSPGVYEIEFTLSSNSSTNSDMALMPNNTTYPATVGGLETFRSWWTGSSDAGTAGGPWVAPNPTSYSYDYGFPGMFGMDIYDNSNSSDIVNDRGPMMNRITCVTTTTGKILRYMSGIHGGFGSGFCWWQDTTTPWTSLGTLWVAVGANNHTSKAVISGTAIVRKIA